MRLAGKVAIIIGAASGMGAATEWRIGSEAPRWSSPACWKTRARRSRTA
jgi:hypothetical protein